MPRRALAPIFLLFLTGVLACAAPVPSPDAGRIGLLVGKLLATEHFRRQPLDDAISAQLLKIYLDDLDYNHLFFLQSDLAEFQPYSSRLDDEILKGSVQPAFDIFGRYVQRVEECVALVEKLLGTPNKGRGDWPAKSDPELFAFDGNDSILLDRHEAPWPSNVEEARRLWKQRIKYELLLEKLNKKKYSEARDIILRRYRRLLRSVHEDDADSVLQIYLTALAKAYDPHSDYLPPSEFNNFEIQMKLSLAGIGAILTSDDGYPKVVAIVPGGPADLDKHLKVNDRIAAVAQGNGAMVDVVDMRLTKAVEMIRGDKNTEVRLLVIPAAATDPSTRVEIRLKRNEIKLTDAEAKARLIERKDAGGKVHRIGVIDLPSFYAEVQGGPEGKSTTRDMSRLLEELKSRKIEGLVLDLRKNGGGSLAEAISLTGLFIRRGPVLQVKDSDGRVRVLADEDPSVAYEGPLLILVSHVSASASEILAAALQDYGRAVIVGDQNTFGKGTVQKVEDLGRFLRRMGGGEGSGGALKVTTQKFYRVSGGSTQYRGVIPDIQLPSTLDYMKINEASLKNALPYDEVPPAIYRPVGNGSALWPELRKRSQARLSKDPEYSYIREDIPRLKAQLEEKAISLNESRRREMQKTDLARLDLRKKERATRKSDEQITEITLATLSHGGTNAPSLTRKVIEQANANLKESDDESTANDSTIDPLLEEGMNLLSDFIQLTGAPHSG